MTNTRQAKKGLKVLPQGNIYRCVFVHVFCSTYVAYQNITQQLTAVFFKELGLTPLICETELSKI